MVDSYGTNLKGFSDLKLNYIAARAFDLRPGCIIRDMRLKRPIFGKLSGFGHFGRTDPDFPWESFVDLSKFAEFSDEQLKNKDGSTDFSGLVVKPDVSVIDANTEKKEEPTESKEESKESESAQPEEKEAKEGSKEE